MDTLKVLMFSKRQNVFCDYAEAILQSNFSKDQYLSIRGDIGDGLDIQPTQYAPEYVISFLSPWIIPKEILNTARKASLNFHPGSPDYPGTGCYNFAIYEKSKRYGVTVHHMKEKVDTGDIIMTSYFNISPFESVETLKLKSMNHLLYCFEKIASCIAADVSLPVSNETWKRKPFTRAEMKKLFEIIPSRHDQEEVERRIRASAYPSKTGAYVMLANRKFYLPCDNRKPIVE